MEVPNDWHMHTSDAVQARLHTNMYTGLPREEAANRRKQTGANGVWYIRRASAREYALACLCDLASLLLLLTAVLAAVFSENRTMALSVCGLLGVGTAIRSITYMKAKRILERNAEARIPTCTVLRDGKLLPVSALHITVGDVVFLEAGDVVPGDGRVLAAQELHVSERGITDNRESVEKFDTVITTREAGSQVPPEVRSNMLYAGSTVLRGTGRMAVTSIGGDTLIGRRQGGIPVPAGETLPLMNRLNRWCRNSSLCMLAGVLFITVLALFLHRPFTQTFLTAMAMAVASMSEYMSAIAYILLAVSIRDAGGKNEKPKKTEAVSGPAEAEAETVAVITDASVVEPLAGIRQLVLDDVRLLKSGEMALHSWYAGERLHELHMPVPDGAACRSLERLLSYALATVGTTSPHMALSGAAVTAMPEKYTVLQEAAHRYCAGVGREIRYSFAVLDQANSTAGLAGGLDTVLIEEKEGVYAVVSGPIDWVMRCCTAYENAKGSVVPLTDAVRQAIFRTAAERTVAGADVVAVARRLSPFRSLNHLGLLQSNLCFLGFLTVTEAPAYGVREAAAALCSAGISVVLLSDVPERDLYYAREVGLFAHKPFLWQEKEEGRLPENRDGIVQMPPVRSVSFTENVRHAVQRQTRLRTLLGEKRPHTAVLCRHVLDAPLLSCGEVGIAVSDSRQRPVAQPLKSRARVIACPSAGQGGLAETVAAMVAANRAMSNLWNGSVYLLASQISRIVLLLFAVLLGFPMLSPQALLSCGLLLDFSAVLAMAFVPADMTILRVPPQRKGLPLGWKTFLAIAGLGILWGGACGAILPLTAIWKTDAYGTLSASVFLAQAACAAALGQREPLVHARFHTAMAGFALACFTLAWWEIVRYPAVWYTCFFALLPAAVVLLAVEGWKFLTAQKAVRQPSRPVKTDNP